MGNCLFGRFGDDNNESLLLSSTIKVLTSNGGIMEFGPPITAGSISNEFTNHAIFPTHDLFWKPLENDEELQVGNSYYLLPLDDQAVIRRQGHVRSKTSPCSTSNVVPYRVSFDNRGMFKGSSYREVNNDGFWKVKLVINSERLLDILSQEGKTEELIESIRVVAKCSGSGSVSVSEFSDQWSLSSSSRNASCRN